MPSTRLDEARLIGMDHGLDAIAAAKLVEDPADMRLHGRLAKRETAADPAGTVELRDELRGRRSRRWSRRPPAVAGPRARVQ